MRLPEAAPHRAPALAQAYEMPPDMVQVETAHSTAAPESELTEDLPRPRRPRPAMPAAASEPLVQVETRPATSQTD
jgi:hypothetical protein